MGFFFYFHSSKYACISIQESVFLSFNLQKTSEHGGWVSTSDLSVTVTPNDRNKMISCYAINQELGETIQKSHMVSVLCKQTFKSAISQLATLQCTFFITGFKIMGLSLQKNCHFFLNFLVSFFVCYKRRMDLTLMDKKGLFFNRAKLSSFVKSYIF